MNQPLSAGCTVGILAGNGTYPFTLADSLLASGHKVVVAGIKDHFSGLLPFGCLSVKTFGLGALEKKSRFFSSHGATNIFLAGGVDRKKAWRSLNPDHHALSLIPKALFLGDDSFLKMVAKKMEELGLEVCDPFPYLRDILAAEGLMAGPPLDSELMGDVIEAGKAAMKLGTKDLGQAALVFQGEVIGLEKRDGTDALIASAPEPGAVLVKVSKPDQDLRFDIPTIGASTARNSHEAGIKAIGVEAGKVLLLERDLLVEICDRKDISLVGIHLE